MDAFGTFLAVYAVVMVCTEIYPVPTTIGATSFLWNYVMGVYLMSVVSLEVATFRKLAFVSHVSASVFYTMQNINEKFPRIRSSVTATVIITL